MRLTEALISSIVVGDSRTIQSSVWTRSLPSQTDLPLGRNGGWNVIASPPVMAARTADMLAGRMTQVYWGFHPCITPWRRRATAAWPATAIAVALASSPPILSDLYFQT